MYILHRIFCIVNDRKRLSVIGQRQGYRPAALNAKIGSKHSRHDHSDLWQRVEARAVEAIGADDTEGLARRTRLTIFVAPLFE